MVVTAPCKDCPDRYPGCHSKCPKYQQFKEDNEKRKQAEQEQKRRDDVMYASIRRRRH